MQSELKAQFPSSTEAAEIAPGKSLFLTEVDQGGSGCVSCHHNGNKTVDGVPAATPSRSRTSTNHSSITGRPRL